MKSNLLKIIVISVTCILAACTNQASHDKPIVIGVVEPIEHAAMSDIVKGFESALKAQYKKPFIIKVENAQNDLNLQRAIIQKMKDAKYDMIVPIGTAASQMAINMTTQPIVSLAANLSESERRQLKHCNMTVVHDEISSAQLLAFVHKAFPNITRIMLVHSAADTVLPQVEKTVHAGKSLGITVSHRMVTSLNELYTVLQSLPAQYDAILILKDNLIASGASTISLVAQKKKVPFIASDEGSVKAGVDLALGVREQQIGIEGGFLAARILKGAHACTLPIVDVSTLSVFINDSHPAIQVNKHAIETAAHALHYSVQSMEKE